MSTLTSAIAAQASSAFWNPLVSAAASTAAVLWVVAVECATMIAAMIASPRPPPTCCDVLMRPDASPCSSFSTPSVAAIAMPGNTGPIPMATSSEGQPRLERREAARILPVERQHEEHRPKHPWREQTHQIGACEGALAKDGERYQRTSRPRCPERWHRSARRGRR
jgi:hypothetical protein